MIENLNWVKIYRGRNIQSVLETSQMFRLDAIMNNDLNIPKANESKQENILKRAKNDGSKLGFVSVVILVIFSGLVYFSIGAWEQYKAYQSNQKAKFAQLEQQQKQVMQPRKDNGQIKPIALSEQPQSSLKENIQSLHFEPQPIEIKLEK